MSDAMPGPEHERDIAREYARVQVGEVIAVVMQEENLTAAEVAARAGVAVGVVERMLAGRGPTTVDELAVILHAFGRRLVLEPIRQGELSPAERGRPQ